MSDSKDLPRDFPANEHIFSIDVVGDTTKKRYRGNFKYRVPNLAAKSKAAKFEVTLNAGLKDLLAKDIQHFHSIISFLRFTIVEAPDWWTEADWGYELMDFKVVDAVYEEAEKFQKEWEEAIWGKPEESKESKSKGKSK